MIAGSTAQWHVYILRCADHSLYTGVATDVAARVLKHNSGKGAKYTRGRLPAVLVYQEKLASHGAALKREYAIKCLPLTAKQRLVSGY
ncbi:MAG: GIY-YIG nuclease family protein [Gammaproteobacteria bacterium]|nr:GIY-YIG nuclease family protein [Gammaproteobacteria bacterium]